MLFSQVLSEIEGRLDSAELNVDETAVEGQLGIKHQARSGVQVTA